MKNSHAGKKAILEVPADLFFSASIRDFGKDMFKMSGFDDSWQNKLKLVVDELFMNAVKYGSDPRENVYLIFEVLHDGIIFSIEDTGTGKKGCSVEALQKKVQSHKDDNSVTKTSGRGLAMFTDTWSDGFEITKSSYGGIKISFKKLVNTESKKMNENIKTPSVTKQKEKQITVQFEGEIDQFTIEKNTKPIEEMLKKNLVNTELILDFEKVTYINSTFIGHIAALYTNLLKRNSSMKIIKVNQDIYEIFQLVGLTKIMNIEKYT